MVLDMVFTTHPLLVLPLPIKQLNIFPVPLLLWPRIWLRIWTPPPPSCSRPCCRRGRCD